MGFLLGAFGKQMAGKRVRSLQSRMMHVQSKMRTAARNVENIEKQISAQEKIMKNNLSQMSMSYQYGTQVYMQGELAKLSTSIFGNKFANMNAEAYEQLSDDDKKAYQIAQSNYTMQSSLINSQVSSMNQMSSMQIQQMQSQMEQEIEMMRETMLEPAKDEEEELQSEKDSLESQIQLAQQDYEACKEMEKQGAKDFAPNYTGQ